MGTALYTGLTALQAHQRAMDTTAHNLANASTPGYSRQRVDLTTETPQSVKPGQLGRGVQIASIKRITDDFITARLRSVNTETGKLDEMSKYLEGLELIFNEPSDSGLTAATNRMYGALQDLTNNPESNAVRSAAVQEVITYTTTLNSIYDQFDSQRETIIFAMQEEVRNLNSELETVYQLNQSIRSEYAAGRNPNDMEDQREVLLTKIAQRANVRVQKDLSGTVRIELGGRTVVSNTGVASLVVQSDEAGTPFLAFGDGSGEVNNDSGSLGALGQIAQEILPGVLDNLNTLAINLMGEMNKLHSTGNNNSFQVNSFESERIIGADELDVNLDDASQIQVSTSVAGIPEILLPDFTDTLGDITTKNLTINIYDPAAKTGEKFTVRYDPGPDATSATRSLRDLIHAINTGKGGGFTVYPPIGGGVRGVTAEAIPVDGGYRLQIKAEAGKTLDFSRALDLDIAQDAWTGGTVIAQAATTIPFLANNRIEAEVMGTGAGQVNLRFYMYDPDDGTRREINNLLPKSITLTLGAAAANFAVENQDIPPIPASFNLSLQAANDAPYSVGECFAIDFDSQGNLVINSPATSSFVQQKTWSKNVDPVTGEDLTASVSIKGRYLGEQTLTPGKPWDMEVIQSGVVGNSVYAAVPNGAPIVKFTYYVGSQSNPIAESTIITLDEHNPAGSPIMISEGVYAVFGDGTLTLHTPALPNKLSFTVDAKPDEAGILSALGVNSMFSGRGASDIKVSNAIATSPSKLLVGHTRAAGDNQNIVAMAKSREDRIFGSGITIDEFYQEVVSSIAVQKNQTENLKKNQEALKQSLQTRRDEISGVSIDEEVGILILEQQAYQAAAKIISTEKQNIDTLMSILG